MSKIATRERILHAALEVFARKGYHRAMVDDIVRASDTSKGAVYNHFPNKEALFAIAGSHGALAKVEAALRAGQETRCREDSLVRKVAQRRRAISGERERRSAWR